MLRWFRTAMHGQRASSWPVKMTWAPASFVVLVHGMWKLVDLEPSLRVRNVILQLYVSIKLSRKEILAYSAERKTCSFPSKESMVVTVVSPRRRHPKKVVSTVAQTAAWKGSERSMA